MLNRCWKRAVQRTVKTVGLGALLGVGLHVSPAAGAENVVLKYGLFSRSIPVESLTNYSETGQASGGLEALLRSVSDGDRPAMLKLLDARLPFGVLEVDQILKEPYWSKIFARCGCGDTSPRPR